MRAFIIAHRMPPSGAAVIVFSPRIVPGVADFQRVEVADLQAEYEDFWPNLSLAADGCPPGNGPNTVSIPMLTELMCEYLASTPTMRMVRLQTA